MAVLFAVVSVVLGKFKLAGATEHKARLYIVLSAVAGGLSWLCYFAALKIGPAAGVAAMDRLSIVVIIILAAVFLAEPITWKAGLGALLITLGALLFIFK